MSIETENHKLNYFLRDICIDWIVSLLAMTLLPRFANNLPSNLISFSYVLPILPIQWIRFDSFPMHVAFVMFASVLRTHCTVLPETGQAFPTR